MTFSDHETGERMFRFRPWVKRAGLSIIVVAALITAAIVAAFLTIPGARYGWIGERFVWVYVGVLWLGGAKVFAGTLKPVAEVGREIIVLRPLHKLRARVVRWEDVMGTEQMVDGDRLIVYFTTPRGMRFVALNLNLVRARRDFLMLVDARLKGMGFSERVVDRSRYLTR